MRCVTRLQALGVIRESGHEHFNGSLVVPVFDVSGGVVGMYGRKITANLRDGYAAASVSARARTAAYGMQKPSRLRKRSFFVNR